jgi:hypothetical protein
MKISSNYLQMLKKEADYEMLANCLKRVMAGALKIHNY